MRREATPPPRRTPTTVSPSSRYALLCGFRCDESFHLHPSSEGRRRSGNLRFSRLHLLSCAALDRRPASRMRRRKSCAMDDALRKKERAAASWRADGFAWGKTPIDVGGKHPSLSRSPPPAPAIDSQRRLTPPAEKRAKGGAWVAARLRIPTAEVFMCTRRSATAVVIATALCLGPPTARAQEPPGGIDQSVHHTFAPSASSTGAASSPARGPGGRRLRPESVLERGTDRVGPQQRGRLDDGDGRPDAEKKGSSPFLRSDGSLLKDKADRGTARAPWGGSGRSRW